MIAIKSNEINVARTATGQPRQFGIRDRYVICVRRAFACFYVGYCVVPTADNGGGGVGNVFMTDRVMYVIEVLIAI